MAEIVKGEHHFEIEKLSPAKVAAVSALMERRGIRVAVADATLHGSVEFQAELARACVSSWTDGNGFDFKKLSSKEQVELLKSRKKVTSWIVAQASKLADAEDKEFDEDSGN
jgi:hypothetical protein